MNSLIHLENNYTKLTIQTKNVNEASSNINKSLLLPINTDKITSLNLSNCNLSVLPEWFTFANLLEVDLSGNNFENVPYLIYVNNKIQQLNISKNKIRNFDVKPKCSSTLLTINLSDNYLEQIPAWIFSENCDDLQTLILNNNPLKCWPTNILGRYMKNLRLLQMNNTNMVLCNGNGKNRHLTEIPKLENLHFSNISTTRNTNILKEIPIEMFTFREHLKELHLTGLGLSAIPENFILFGHLEVLDLRRNYISWFPDNFTRITSLKKLTVTGNEILTLPQDIGCLVNLEELFIAENCVGTLPDSMRHLNKLKTLDCYSNYFTEHVIDLITQMDGIIMMDFEQNMFQVPFEGYIQKREKLRQTFELLRSNGCRIFDDDDSFSKEFTDDESTSVDLKYEYYNDHGEVEAEEEEEENWDTVSVNSISDDMNLMIPAFKYYAKNVDKQPDPRSYVDPLYFEDAD